MTDNEPKDGSFIRSPQATSPEEARLGRRIDDVYGWVVSDEERKTLLSGPTPLVTEALADTVRGLTNAEAKHTILTKIVNLGTKGGKLQNVVQGFYDYATETGGKTPPAPFHNGLDSGYLSVFCGFIEGTRQLTKSGKSETVKEIENKLRGNARKILANNPNVAEGQKAIEVIINNFNKEPEI